MVKIKKLSGHNQTAIASGASTAKSAMPFDPEAYDRLLRNLRRQRSQNHGHIHVRQKRIVREVLALAGAVTTLVVNIKKHNQLKKMQKKNEQLKKDLDKANEDIAEMKVTVGKMQGEIKAAKAQVEKNKLLMQKNLAAIQANGKLIADNGRAIDANLAELDRFGHQLDQQFTLSMEEFDKIVNQLNQLMDSVVETKREVLEHVEAARDRIMDALTRAKIEPIISHLNTFFAYFVTESRRLNQLPVRQRVAKLEDANGVMEYFRSLQNSQKGSLGAELGAIIEQRLALPKGPHDSMAPVFLNLLCYGAQVYALVLVFLMQQYGFLAAVYHRRGDIEAYNTYYRKIMATFGDFAGQLFNAKNALFDKVIEVLHQVKELDFVQKDSSEASLAKFAAQSIRDLDSIRDALVKAAGSFASRPPDKLSVKLEFPRDAKKGNVAIKRADTVAWRNVRKVSYAIQYVDPQTNLSTMISDWSRPFTVTKYSNPIIRGLPLDPEGRVRMIYRRFDGQSAELCAVITNHSLTEFRDINRDMFKAAFEPNEAIALEQIERYLKAGADANAQFESGKRALHVALENRNNRVSSLLIASNASVNVTDSDGHTPMYIAAQTGNSPLVAKMVALGANVNAKTNKAFLQMTPLHGAIYKGHVDIIATLLKEARLDLNSESNNGLSPLHFAASLDRLDIVRMLIGDNRTRLDARSKQLHTPLHMAAVGDSDEVAESLLKSGTAVDVNARAVDHTTPLHLSAVYGSKKVFSRLLKGGARVDARTVNGSVPLHYAAHHGDRTIVSQLVTANQAIVNAQNNDEQTPLYIAFQRNNTEAAAVLMHNCAKMELRVSRNKTLLHVAAGHGDSAVAVNLITKGGIPVDTRDASNFTALHYAVRNGRLATAQVLLKRGADANAKGRHDQTPLHFVVFPDESTSLKLARLLVDDYQANVNAPTAHVTSGSARSNMTTLHWAVGFGYYRLVRYLINNGANVAVGDSLSRTPLHDAAEGGQLEIAQLLLSNGAPVDAKALIPMQDPATKSTVSAPTTPLHLAAKGGNLDMVKLLLGHSADINATGFLNRTAAFFAIAGKGTLEMVKYLEQKKANLKAMDQYKTNLVNFAAQFNRMNIAQFLIEKGGVDFKNFESTQGNQPLHAVAYNGNREFFQYLVDKGANCGSTSLNKQNKTPLMLAIEGSGSLDFVKLVVECERKSDAKATGKKPIIEVSLAAKADKFDVLKYLIDEGHDCKTKSYLGLKPIHYAVANANHEMVRLLLTKGVDLNEPDASGKVALLHAVEGQKGGDRKFIKYLIDRGAKFDGVKDSSGFNLADIALKRNSTEVALYLMKDLGVAFKEQYGSDGATALHIAAGLNNRALCEYILGKSVEINVADSQGRSPLYSAIDQHGDLSLVKFLHSKGADLINYNKTTSNSFVYQAILRQKFDVAKYLIEQGADFKNEGVSGETPLHEAVRCESVDMIRLLIQKGARSQQQNRAGLTPASLAVVEKKEKALGYFLFEYRGPQGKLPIHEAAGKGDLATLRFLLERGANVNARDRLSATALHTAAQNGNLATVKLLVAQGCIQLEAKDGQGKTPLDVAEDNERDEVAQFLRKLLHTSEDAAMLRYGNGAKALSSSAQSQFANLPKLGHAQVNLNATLLLADLIARKKTGQKYVPTNSHSTNAPSSAKAFALNLTDEFEELLRDISLKTGISLNHYDAFKLYQTVESLAFAGNYKQIEQTLLQYSRAAFPAKLIKQNKEFQNLLASSVDKLLIELPLQSGQGQSKKSGQTKAMESISSSTPAGSKGYSTKSRFGSWLWFLN